jgi:hypothetical protein
MIECVKWPPSDRRAEDISLAASGPIDWKRLLNLAERHRVVGLVNSGLRQIGRAVPAEIVAEFGARFRTLVQSNLTMAAEAVRLLHLFEGVNLPVVFLKGAALSRLIYGGVELRQSDDIDILVPPERFAEASALLQRAGYNLYDPPPQTSATQLRFLHSIRKDFGYIHHRTNMKVELHWSLFLNPHFMTKTPVWTTSRTIELTTGVELRTLNDDDLFAYLCAHGASHWWNRLQWLADIGALLATASPERIGRLCDGAEVRGVGRAVSFALLLCRDVLSTETARHVASDSANGLAMKWMRLTALGAMGISTDTRERASIALGTTRGSLSTFLLKKGWRYRLAELRGLLTCQEDILTVRLPYPLRALYPCLRLPFWLWRQIIRVARDSHQAR